MPPLPKTDHATEVPSPSPALARAILIAGMDLAAALAKQPVISGDGAPALRRWNAVMARLKTEREEQAALEAFRTAAKEEYEFGSDGDVDIDQDAIVSKGEEGAYVMAWVYVRNEDAA